MAITVAEINENFNDLLEFKDLSTKSELQEALKKILSTNLPISETDENKRIIMQAVKTAGTRFDLEITDADIAAFNTEDIFTIRKNLSDKVSDLVTPAVLQHIQTTNDQALLEEIKNAPNNDEIKRLLIPFAVDSHFGAEFIQAITPEAIEAIKEKSIARLTLEENIINTINTLPLDSSFFVAIKPIVEGAILVDSEENVFRKAIFETAALNPAAIGLTEANSKTEEIISNASAKTIYDAARKKYQDLLKEKISLEINGIKAPDHDHAFLLAVASIQKTVTDADPAEGLTEENLFRNAILDHLPPTFVTTLGLTKDNSAELLPNEIANDLYTQAKTRYAHLQNEKTVLNAIAGIDDPNHDFFAVNLTTTDQQYRLGIVAHLPEIARSIGLDVTPNPTILSNESIGVLKEASLLKQKQLQSPGLIKHEIENLLTTLTHNAFKEIETATEAKSIRELLVKNGLTGTTGLTSADVDNEKILTHSATLTVRQEIINQRNKVLLDQIKAKTQTSSVDSPLIEALSKTSADDAAMKTTLIRNRVLLGLDTTPDSFFNSLSSEQLKEIRNSALAKIAINNVSKALVKTTSANDENVVTKLVEPFPATDDEKRARLIEQKDLLGITEDQVNSLSSSDITQLYNKAIIFNDINNITDEKLINDLAKPRLSDDDVRKLIRDNPTAFAKTLALPALLTTVVDENFAKEISLHALKKEVELKELKHDPKTSPEQILLSQNRLARAVENLRSLSSPQIQAIVNNVEERAITFKKNIETAVSKADQLSKSESRDEELPAFHKRLVDSYNQIYIAISYYQSQLRDLKDASILNLPAQRKRDALEDKIKIMEAFLNKLNDALDITEAPENQPGKPLMIGTRSVKTVVIDDAYKTALGASSIKAAVEMEIANSLGDIDTIVPVGSLVEDRGLKVAGVSTHLQDPIVCSSKIELGMPGFKKEIPVVSVQQKINGVQVATIHCNKEDLSRFGEEGYMKWAVTEIENFRMNSKNSKVGIKIQISEPKELVEAMVKYCEIRGYKATNVSSHKYTPSRSELGLFKKKLNDTYGDELPGPDKKHAASFNEAASFKPSR